MKRIFIVVLAVFVVMITVMSGIAVTGRWWMSDSAGFTQHQVQQQTAKEQYRLFGERLQELWDETERLQRLTHEGEWDSADVGRTLPGTYSPRDVLGTTSTNSYLLQTQKAHTLPKGESHMEAFMQGIEQLGYSYTKGEDLASGTQCWIEVELPSGGIAVYRERTNGRALLEVFSGAFWGDPQWLVVERMGRDFARPPSPSPPGMNPEFPAWEAPKKN